jgi:ATP-dependent helicase/nuclease subunit A
MLYTADGALVPVADAVAPEAVLRAKADASDETLKEHRRLLYVALTRAKDRLYVAGFQNRRGVRDGSWYALCARAAEAVGTEVERDGETVRVLGELADDAAEPRLPFETPPLALKPWLDRPARKERADPRLIHPSEASGEDEPAPSKRPAVRFRRGQLVHVLLARLPELPEAKRRAAALRYLKARGVDDPDALADETLRVLNDPRFAPAFAAASRAEVGLTAQLPELGPTARVNGRIDRLAITENEVLIVDFKTNRPPPANEAELARLYKTQMALYRAAAAKVFPGKRIACALVWTEGPSLMPLTDALLEAEMGRIAAHIDFAAPRS